MLSGQITPMCLTCKSQDLREEVLPRYHFSAIRSPAQGTWQRERCFTGNACYRSYRAVRLVMHMVWYMTKLQNLRYERATASHIQIKLYYYTESPCMMLKECDMLERGTTENMEHEGNNETLYSA